MAVPMQEHGDGWRADLLMVAKVKPCAPRQQAIDKTSPCKLTASAGARAFTG